MGATERVHLGTRCFWWFNQWI